MTGLTFAQQLERLDEDFNNDCLSFIGAIDGVKSRKKPTNLDEYTYMVSAMKTLFTKINNMSDTKDMFKLTIFSREFLPLFPECVKDKVQERINRMQDVEDMDDVLRDLDYLKWQLVSSSSNSNSSRKNQNQQPMNNKKLFHASTSQSQRSA